METLPIIFCVLPIHCIQYTLYRLRQCFPTFFQPRHTFLEPLTRRHTAFMGLILYTRLTYYYIFFFFIIQKYVKFVFAKLNRSFLQAALSLHLFYIQDLHIITYFSPSLLQKYVKFVFAKLNRSFLQAALSLHLFYIQDLHIITYFSPSLLQKSIKFVFAKLNPSFLQAALSISCNFFAICRSKKSSW